MALNYGTLKTLILTLSKRSDLSALVEDFVRGAEGMIRRDLIAYELQATLDESDRSSEGVYTAPATCLKVQNVFTDDVNGRSYPLERVGQANIRNLTAVARVQAYAHYAGFIEFRGVPATDQELEVHFLGMPAALDDDTDENALLTDHEELYVAGGKFQLYKYTEDIELAQAELDTFSNAIERLNNYIGRKLSGGVTAPAYNFGTIRRNVGY